MGHYNFCFRALNGRNLSSLQNVKKDVESALAEMRRFFRSLLDGVDLRIEEVQTFTGGSAVEDACRYFHLHGGSSATPLAGAMLDKGNTCQIESLL